ncbi:hypothetical protein P4O66_013235, partial [Electrophorus voltai]
CDKGLPVLPGLHEHIHALSQSTSVPGVQFCTRLSYTVKSNDHIFFSPLCLQASGVAISDEVLKHFEQIRVRYHGSEEKERFKLVIMRLSEDKKSIVVDHKCSLKIKDLEKEADIFKKIISMLPDCDCRYCLYDCFYKTKESSKQDLVFIMWAPDSASMQNKMVYASSKVALKAKFQGQGSLSLSLAIGWSPVLDGLQQLLVFIGGLVFSGSLVWPGVQW